MEHFEITTFLSRFIGITFVVYAVAIASNLNLYTVIAKRLTENPLLLYLEGTINLILGLLIIFFHNHWVYGWPVLVTLVGWMMLLKGGIRLIYPRFVLAMARKLEGKYKWLLGFASLFLLVYGAALLYFGYWIG